MAQSWDRLAYEHLRDSLTKGNLWLYILSVLEEGAATPAELKDRAKERFGVSAASITFYSVLYRLGREGLVKKSTARFRSAYEATAKGREELERGRRLIRDLGSRVARQSRES